jgi:hypothetical protein
MEKALEIIGPWSFIGGVVIAILAGGLSSIFAQYAATIVLLLIILGLIVGILNITDKEATEFLIASIALMVLAGTGAGLVVLDNLVQGLGTALQKIVLYIAVFVAPAALVVSLKKVHDLASTK